MFRFTIRDVLWLTTVVGLAVCLWIDHRSLIQLATKSRLEQQQFERKQEALQQRIERQQEAVFALTKENSEMQEQLRKRQILNEAKPGVFYLGPNKP